MDKQLGEPMVTNHKLGGSGSAHLYRGDSDASATTRPRRFYGVGKRVLDIALSTPIMVLGVPIFLAIIILTRIESPGPVLFLQERVGHHRIHFRILKFRTMYHDADESVHEEHHRRLARADDDASQVLRLTGDDRVTRLGGFLRKWSLDELPNLWNVLKGEMSLVGPRPLIPYEVALFDEEALRRLIVKPGVSGLAQVNGRLDVTAGERSNLDLVYVDTCSMWGDIVILAKTVPTFFRNRGQ